MRSRTSTGYVLAGIDGGRSDTDALAWAMEAAARHGAECVIAGPARPGPTARSRATNVPAARPRAAAMLA
jgi:hypothetical protein